MGYRSRGRSGLKGLGGLLYFDDDFYHEGV